jgi:hypothetical protein
MLRSFLFQPSIVYILEAADMRGLIPPTRQELKRQLAEATLFLARARDRHEARAASKLITLLLQELGPQFPVSGKRRTFGAAATAAKPPKRFLQSRARAKQRR